MIGGFKSSCVHPAVKNWVRSSTQRSTLMTRMSIALHILGQRGYTIILVIPASVVSSTLSSAGKFVRDWPSVAHGDGFVPPFRCGLSDIPGHLMACIINDNPDCQNGEAIVYRGISQSYHSSRDYSLAFQSLSEYNCNASNMTCLKSHSLPSRLNEVAAGPISSVDASYCPLWVQPGDINGFKAQLVKLLELSGGCLPLAPVPADYQKLYGRPLYVCEYGAFKLVNLFQEDG